MELKERERYVFVIICTFSGEIWYRDLEEREREKRNTCGEKRRDSSLSWVCLKGNNCFYYFGMLL